MTIMELWVTTMHLARVFVIKIVKRQIQSHKEVLLWILTSYKQYNQILCQFLPHNATLASLDSITHVTLTF